MTTTGPPEPGNELLRIRERLGYTQEDMARALDLLLRTYQRYEKGETTKVPSEVVDKARLLKKKR